MSATINEVVATTMERELDHLQNIVGLCAFAVETKRICADIDRAAKLDSTFAKKLQHLVEAHSNWTEMPDTLAYVLIDVRDRLAELGTLAGNQPAETN